MGVLDSVFTSPFTALFSSGLYTDNLFIVGKDSVSLYGLEDKQLLAASSDTSSSSGSEG